MESPGLVLVLDDDPGVLKAARFALTPAATVQTAGHPSELDTLLTSAQFDLVLLDMNYAPGVYSGREGLEALAHIRAADPALSVVLMTAYGGVSLAIEALKRGAADFVLKPWRNEALLKAVQEASALTRLRRAGETFDLDAVERNTIARALAHHGGNMTKAAAALGLTRYALYRRLAKHGL